MMTGGAVVSRVKPSVVAADAPARLDAEKVRLWAPSTSEGVKLQLPDSSAVTVPSTLLPSRITTALPGSVRPPIAGSEVMLSELLSPVSSVSAAVTVSSVVSSVRFGVAVPTLPAVVSSDMVRP